MMNNNNRSWARRRAHELFGELATERAQAEEMEIKEMDPNGDMVIATEEGVTTSRITPEDSLYSADSPERIQMRETTKRLKKMAESEEDWNEFAQTYWDDKESEEDEESGVNYLLDPLFDGFKGIIQTFTGMNSGAVMRNQQTIDELNFMERALQIEEQFKAIDKQLDAAYLAEDVELIRKLYPHKATLSEAYQEVLPDLNRAKRKYWEEVTNREDKYLAIEDYRNELLESNATDAKDMERWNNFQNTINQNVYNVSQEWDRRKEGDWGVLYQLPNALGTSASSLLVSVGTGLGAAAANAAATSPALSSGPAGAAVVGGAAVIGLTTSIAGTLLARNQESLSEVSNNYTAAIQEYAQKHGIDTSEIIAEGRRKLHELTGSYSDDPNDPEYRDDSQVLTGMLTYGIELGDLQLEKASKISRRRLEDVYTRNMMLAVSDVAQNFVMIPGVGKFLNKAFKGADDIVADAATKTIDDIMRYTSAKVARASAESVAKRTSKYIVDPIVRVGYTGLSEGFEELSQYMYGKQMDPDAKHATDNSGNINFYSPFDILATSAENFGMLVKGIEGLMGISSDKALNNDKELATNFKVGALVGALMGGVSTFGKARKEFNSYNKGRALAREMVREHVNAREAMFRYNQYAEKAIGGALDWNAFSSGFDNAINSENLPDTWTVEELEKEKAAAKNIFAMASTKPIKAIPKKHRAAALAYLQYQQDCFEETKNISVTENAEFINKLNNAVKGYCDLHGIDDIHAPLLAEYFRLKEGRDALKRYEESWLMLKGQKDYFVDPKKADNKLIELAETRKAMEEELYIVEQQLRNSNLIDKVENYNTLPSVNDDIASNTVENVLKTIALKDIQDNVRNVLNDPKALERAAIRYKQSIADNEQLEEEVRRFEDENLDAAIQEQENEEEKIIEEVEGTGLSTEEDPFVVFPTEADDETSYTPLTEEQDEISTEDNSVVIETSTPEESATQPSELSAASVLEEAEQSYYSQFEEEDIEDYDQTYYSEELSEESLDNDPAAISEQFEEQIIEENKRNREEIKRLSDENEQMRQTIAQFEERFNDLERRLQAAEQNVPRKIVEHPEQPSKPVTEEDAQFEENIPEDQYIIEQPTGTAEIFYNPTNTRPMMSEYESGASLNEYFSTPGTIESSSYSAWVGDKNSPYGMYDPNDRSTWDNAAVYVEITGANGKKYITALKTIQGAKELAFKLGKEFTSEQEEELRNLRNTIIAAKIADPNAEITFGEVRMSAGKLNNQRDSEGRAVQRKLTDIKGLNLPKDLHQLFDPSHGIRFGIGKGIVGGYVIVDQRDMPLPGIGRSGKIYIYPAASSTMDGVSRPIQLTEKRFTHTTGDTNSFAYQIANALLYGHADIDGIPVNDLLNVMLNYGEGTLLEQDDARRSIMENKQFHIDYKKGIVTLGKNTYSIDDIRSNNGVERIAQFIADELHWNTEKTILWNSLPSSFGQYLNRTGKNKASLFNGELEFDREDLELSGMAFMIKHGYLTSDLADQIYKTPFVYVGKPTIKTTAEPEPEPIGTDSSAMDALLERESEEKDKYESEDDPYTDPDSDEVTNFFGDLNAAPKTIPTHQVGKATKKINEKRARKWLADKLNLSENDVEVLDGVIRTLSNGKSVIGVAKADGIKLSSSAEYGVEYHEAWHRVSLLMLTPEQRQRLYKEFRKTNPKYKHASDKVVEEAMADQFMDYMVADDKEGFKYLVTKYYRKFKHFIRINSNIDHYSLQEMFKAVKYGEMAKYKLDEESLKEFRKAYKHGAAYTIGPNKNVNLASITSPYEYQQLLNSIKSILIASNKLKYISDIQQLDSNKAKEFIQKRMQSPRITTEQREVLREVVDNFDVIMKDLQPIMEKMGIREIDAEHDSDFANRETTGIQNYDKAAYEFNKKDNALGSAKMFLSTIVDTRYSFKDGIKSEPIPVISKLTGLPLIVDYDTAYAKVLRHLSDVETFAPTKIDEDANLSLIGKCRQLGETDPFFAILYKRLLRVDINTETQLLQTIKSFNQNFQEINYQTGRDGKTSFVLSDSINRRAVKNKPRQWSENFFNSRFVNHDGGVSKLDVAALTDIKRRFNSLLQEVNDNIKTLNEEKLNDYLNVLIGLFNELGVTVDRDTFDLLLGNNRINAFNYLMNNRAAGSTYNFFNNLLDSIIYNKPIKDRSGTQQVRQLNEVFIPRGQSIIGLLAEYNVQANPSESEISVLGPNNNVIFTKTLNCFVSDQIRWLNNHDKLVMADFENDPYCASSLIYNTVKNNGKIKLNTFVNFYGLNQNDKGRDYVSISPVEDYIAKMVFTWNNHIIFPTMADKKTWFTISGCKLFNDPFKISRNSQGRLKLEYSVNALDHVYNEWLDEYNTIVEYYNTLSDVTHPIKNYHTSGKGGLFRHHTGYFTVIDGLLKWVDLNAKLKNSKDIKKTLEEIKNELFTGDKDATYQKINDNLARERKAEIDECIRLGIIEKKADGTLTNKLLDSKVLEHFIDKYKKHEDAAVNTFAEHYAIVTMIGNHMLNTNISVEETEKIFTGDPAFFKNNEDKIKRLGAVLSTGDNLRTQWMQATTSTDAAVTAEYTRLQNRQTYTSTVINDNMVQSQQYDLLKQMFTQYYVRQLLIEQGLTEAQIDKLSDEEIKKEHGDVYVMAKTLGEDDASAYGLYKGKGAINQADAAVYVSPAMYRDIVKMLGEWNDEIAEAYGIMESGLEWLNDSAKCAKAMKALIKPLKTTYFCNQYDPNIKHTVPVFDKMAMFPLFRVIATGDNKELYDRMNAIGKYKGQEKIDQIAFESAKKVGVIGASDIYTDYTNESMNDLSKMHVVTQRFRNLRRQLITDPHAHDRTLFGTQVSTVAVSNLVLDRVYQQGTPNEKTGAQIMEDLFGTINAISNKGIVEVTNIYLNDKGEVDLEKTSKALIKKAHSQNMGKDVEDALLLNEIKDDFKIPLSALPDSKWVETALISDVNKKAVDLELPGGAFIQMSSFGINSIRVAKGLDTDFSQYTVNNGKRLVNMNKDGSMDAVISINLLKHIIPGYDKMSFMQARQWLIDNKIIGENAEPAALGYRIPTQGLSSIAGIRISDVLPPVVGDTIILPDEFTAQTGSDFDIDKLYIARYNYEQVWMEDETEFEEWFKSQVIIMAPDERGVKQMAGRFENRKAAKQAFVNEHKGYRLVGDVDTKTDVIQRKKVRIVPFDHSKGYEGNSKEANENLLLRTYLDVLTDKKNVGETRLPLDKTTGIIKDEILPIVDGPAKNQELIPYKELSPTYQMGKKYEYNGGKAGIGPFALNNKNHILTQLTNLVFAPNPLLELLGFTGLNGINSRDEMVIERDDKGRKIKNEDGTYKYKLDKGVRILDWLSAMINAHVDVAKDPYVIRLNVCQYTYNLCNFLLRVGYGKSTFYFLPQPIFKEMSAAYDNASGNYGVDATKSKTKVVQESIQAIRKRYAAEFSAAANRLGKTDIQVTIGNEGVQFNRSVVTRDENGKDKVINTRMSWQDHAKNLMDRDFLIDQLQLSQKEKMTDLEAYDYYLNQLRLSELFEYLNSRAEDMSKLVQLSQIDTKKYGNNFVEQDRFIYRLKALYQNTTLFDPDRMMGYYRDTFLYTKLINGIVTPQAIFEDTMLRSKRPFLDNITKVLMLTIGLEHNDEALNKIISNELEATIRNKFLNGKIDLKGLFYGDNTMAKRLNNLKFDIISGKYPEYRTQDGKITNGLLNHLDVLSKMTSDKYEAPQIITRRAVAENDKNLNSILKEYWSELLNSPHEEIRKFAEDLALYMLATTGGNHTKNGIFNLIPIEYIISSGYGEFMRSMTSQFISSDINFDEFFLNNWHNDKLIKPIKLTKTVVDEFGPRSDDRFPIVRFINKNGASIPVVLNPTMYSKNQNSSKQPVFQPFVKVRLEYDNNPANTLVYKHVGYNVAKMTPVYVLVNKLGLNQNGRVIKEYHRGITSESEFDFNNHPFANISLLSDLSSHQMTESDRAKLNEIVDDFVPVDDYTPVTQALRMNFNPNITRSTKNQITSEQQPQVIDEPAAPINVEEIVEAVEEPVVNIYTFPNGLVVNTGFKLNEQQSHALDVLSDFVLNPEKHNGKITLAGYAGTGKTTIIKFLHEYMKSLGMVPVYSAPTHRANAVTKQNNPDAVTGTLHSLLGLRPTIDLTKDVLNLKDLKTVLNEKGPSDLINDAILIIDEASMIDDSLYELLKIFERTIRGIIFMGDDAQLSPVQNKDGNISKVFTEGKNNLQLTKVERTGDNPILKECTNLRNNQPFTYQTHIVKGEGVVYINSLDETKDKEVLDIINRTVTSQDFRDNPLHFRILCGTNRLVSAMNMAARKALIGDASTPIKAGEILMGYKNQQVGRGVNDQINNSFDYIVVDASNEKEMSVQTDFGTVKYVGQYITIKSLFDSDATPITIKIVTNNNTDAVFDQLAEINKKYLQEVRKLFADKNKTLHAKKMYANWKSFQNSIITMLDRYEGDNLILQKALDFGYSHTIHKSQGGTYNSTMILDSSIENTAFTDLAKQQLRYVAMSRAKHNVWVVTQKPLREEIKPASEPKLIKTKKDVTRAQAMRSPNTLYIFTDNTNRTSGKVVIDPDSWYSKKYKTSVPLHYPNVTSARLRGLENAMPISTQRWYDPSTGRTREQGRWNDSDFEEFKKTIDDEIQTIKETWDTGKYEKVVIATPNGVLRSTQNAGISGMSKDRVPKLYNYLLHKMKELDAYVNGREFNETYEEKAPVKISSIATKDEFAQTAIKTEEQMTAQEKKRAVDLAKNELDFAEGVIEKIDYSAKFRSMSEENKKQRYEMTLRVNKYNALLEGLKTGDSTYIVNEYGVPQVVFINKDIQNTTGDATDIKNLAKLVSSNGITAQYGVEIKPKEWVKANHSQWLQSNPNGIVAYRINFKQFNTVAEANAGRIGNPFSIDQRGADTVEQFFEWLVTGNNFGVAEANEQYRLAIVNKILNTPEDSKILYYTELNRPSHATVIGYLINNKQLLTGNNVSNQFIKSAVQLDLFKDKSTINVYSRDDNGYKELSNFSERPFIMTQKNGTTVSFRSVEQAFQFTKVQYYANNPAVATNIMFSNNPAEIKRFGTTTPMTSEQIAKWDKVSTSLMYRLMLQSFMLNESAKQLLLSTGDAILTHKNERGVEQDKGRFSKLLMQIRDEIRQSELESNFYNGMSQNDINSIEEQKKRQDEQCK